MVPGNKTLDKEDIEMRKGRERSLALGTIVPKGGIFWEERLRVDALEETDYSKPWKQKVYIS